MLYDLGMKKIPLSQGYYTIVDNKDYYWLSQWKWTYMKGYAVRSSGGRKNRKMIYMHRLILQVPKGLFTDHIDHNTLNNQKHNLRIVTKSKNMFNSKIAKHNTSGIKGVHRYTVRQRYKNKIYEYHRWKATITINGKTIWLGVFKNLDDARKIRIEAEKKYFKEFRYQYD